MNKKNLLIGGGILAVILIAIYSSKKKAPTPAPTPMPPTPNPTPVDCTGGMISQSTGNCVFPKQYILNEDFSAAVPTLSPEAPENPNKEFKAGDIVKGYLSTDFYRPDLGNGEDVVNVVTLIDGSVPNYDMVGQSWLQIPIEIVSETAGAKTFANYVDVKSNSFFQPQPMNADWSTTHKKW